MPTPRRPLPALDLSLRTRASAVCERIGLRPAARELGFSHQTLAAALMGAPVLPATARVLALAIDEMERKAGVPRSTSNNNHAPNQAA